MTTFAGVKTQNNHFDLYIQWFELTKDSAIFMPRVKQIG